MVSQDDINLLPPDLRGKEEKIRKRAPQKIWEVKMTSPPPKQPKLKEASKTSWWEELKKFLTQPLGKKARPMPLGSMAPLKMPVFEYEKKVLAKLEEKPKLIEIKAPVKPKEKASPKPSFFAQVFQKKAESKEPLSFPKEKPKLVSQMIKIKKPVPAPAVLKKAKVSFWSKIFKTKKHEIKIEARISTQTFPSQKKEIPPSVKKEAVKEIAAWSKVTEPEKIQPKPTPKMSFWSKIFKKKERKITPLVPSPQKPAKVSFFEKIFGPKIKPVHKETPLAPVLHKKTSFFQKFFSAKEEPTKPAKSFKTPPLSAGGKKKEKAPLKPKKFKSPSISFIPENEVSVKLRFFKKIFLGEIVILLFCFLLGFSYLILLWYHANLMTKSSDLEIKISELKEKIARNQKEEEIMLIDQKRIKAAQVLLDQHIYWSNLFDLLGRYTVDDVYYKDFAVSDFEKITLQAVGADFRSMARQLLVFSQAKDYIKDVKISSGSYSPTGVSFTINLTVDKALFYKLSHDNNSLE